MLTTIALTAAAVLVVGLLVWALVRHERVDETERFHRAREITTSWAAPGPQVHDTNPPVSSPVVTPVEEPADAAPAEPAPAAQTPARPAPSTGKPPARG